MYVGPYILTEANHNQDKHHSAHNDRTLTFGIDKH